MFRECKSWFPSSILEHSQSFHFTWVWSLRILSPTYSLRSITSCAIQKDEQQTHFNRPNPNPSLLLSWYLCWTELCPTLWTAWTVAHQALSMGLPRQEYWSGLPFSRASSRHRDQTHVSCIGRQVLYLQSHLEAPREGRVPGLRNPPPSPKHLPSPPYWAVPCRGSRPPRPWQYPVCWPNPAILSSWH